MKEASLPSPGVSQRGFHLRRLMAQIISDLQIREDKTANGVAAQAAQLLVFLDACRASVATTGKAKPTMTLTSAGNATSVAVGATLQLTVGKGGSSGAVTYVSSDATKATVNSAGLVTGVAAGAVTIRANMAEGSAHKASSRTLDLTVTTAA